MSTQVVAVLKVPVGKYGDDKTEYREIGTLLQHTGQSGQWQSIALNLDALNPQLAHFAARARREEDRASSRVFARLFELDQSPERRQEQASAPEPPPGHGQDDDDIPF